MKESLAVGLEHQQSYTVTDDMSPAHLPAKVLSTPSMVQLIEGTCLQAAQAHLDAGETTVGTHLDISHSGPAFSGETVVVTARLDEVKKRRLSFAVAVHSPRGEISKGRHERAVVELARFR